MIFNRLKSDQNIHNTLKREKWQVMYFDLFKSHRTFLECNPISFFYNPFFFKIKKDGSLGLFFLNTWFTDFFFKILRSEEGKK